MPNSDSAFHPSTQDELAQFVATNAASERRPLISIGGGTSAPKCSAENGIEVCLDQLNRVIDFPARDMTITVEAGVRIADLTQILKAENQRLPIDIPQADQATLGGVIASNWSGPRRYGCGTMRDYVIGISAIDATGRQFKAGGRVVKNVAGYDLCKLLVGSHGTLAIITQVTLKLRPCLETSSLVWMAFDSLKQIDAAIARVLNGATRPIAIEVLNPIATRAVRPLAAAASLPILCVGFEGATKETQWQAETLINECRPFEPRSVETLSGSDADPLWAALTDFPIKNSSRTFKVNRLPSQTIELMQRATDLGISAKGHAGNGIIWGHYPSGSSSTFLLDGTSEPRLWEELGSSGDWMRRVKQQLDPQNLLKPGCLPIG